METTPVAWVRASERLPTKDEFGAYPHVLVAMACKGHPEWGHRTREADLRFFGGDMARPFWAGTKAEGCAPIENDAWFVEFWAPPLQQPNVSIQQNPTALLK